MFRYLNKFRKYTFAIRSNNPYDLIGVNSGDDFSDIKKKYYKLVNKYHPDKNKSQIFLAIKKAYEEIKILRGLSKKKSFISDVKKKNNDDFQSQRPEGQQYNQDFSDFNQFWETSDKQFTHEQRKEYERIRKSFDNIKDINDGQLTILDIELPDVEKRLNLEKLRVTIIEQPSSSFQPLYIMLFMMILSAGGLQIKKILFFLNKRFTIFELTKT